MLEFDSLSETMTLLKLMMHLNGFDQFVIQTNNIESSQTNIIISKPTNYF